MPGHGPDCAGDPLVVGQPAFRGRVAVALESQAGAAIGFGLVASLLASGIIVMPHKPLGIGAAFWMASIVMTLAMGLALPSVPRVDGRGQAHPDPPTGN